MQLYLSFVNLPTPHQPTNYSRDTPAPRGSGRHDIIIAIPGPLAIRSNTPHAFEGILFHSTLCHSTVLHATCSPTAGGEASRYCSAICRLVLSIRAHYSQHTHSAGRAIQLASLSQPVIFTVFGLSCLPAHTNLLQFGRLSH